LPSKTVTLLIPALSVGLPIVREDGARIVLTIQNLNDTGYIDISDDPSAGLRLYPHEKITIARVDGDQPEHRWNGIATANVTLRVLETFDYKHRRPLDPARQRIRTAAARVGETGSPPPPGDGGGGGDPGSFPR